MLSALRSTQNGELGSTDMIVKCSENYDFYKEVCGEALRSGTNTQKIHIKTFIRYKNMN